MNVQGHKDYIESPQCLQDISGALVSEDLCLPFRAFTTLFIASDKDPLHACMNLQRVGTKAQGNEYTCMPQWLI